MAAVLQAQSLIKRTYLLQNIGLEIFFSGRNSLYLTFKSTEARDRLAGDSWAGVGSAYPAAS